MFESSLFNLFFSAAVSIRSSRGIINTSSSIVLIIKFSDCVNSSDTKVIFLILAKFVIKLLLFFIISLLCSSAFLSNISIFAFGGIFFSTLKDLIEEIIFIIKSIELVDVNSL